LGSIRKLWNIANPRTPTELATIPHNENASAIAIASRHDEFVPSYISDRSLVVAGGQGDPQVYAIFNPSRPIRYDALTGLQRSIVNALTIGPDGTRLALASNDHTIRLANLQIDGAFMPIDQAINTICQRGYPIVTEAEWNQYFPQLAYQPPCRDQRDHK
jgi:hypothetical protein